ncbi:3',5'-cyclic-AMP phosphodiesterase [Marinobacter salicampi]|uniref:3',5'-cyclic-AMP phosphodiesterase n=1 Tax=Marinobacter salicampi TaxID=435907 RepID=UPI0014079A11|nr:3',5'-cyclic-AMP phosphodiesterase [Marinobacter salicampi]
MTPNENPAPFKVLQLTDPHLMADPAGALLGVNTRDSLAAVVAQVKQDHFEPDLVLATGDLAQDGSELAYRAVSEQLARFSCPSVWLAGNHDSPINFNKAIAGTVSDQRHLVEGGWQIIALNSSVPGEVHGELANDELAFLDAALAKHPDLPALVTLHHHPVDIGSEWMRNIGLHDREAFWQVIDRWPQVKIVLWGHIHQEFDGYREGVRLLATPSTCIQFEKGSQQFSVEENAPGYRWFNLYASGAYETDVARAHGFTYELDTNSTGY